MKLAMRPKNSPIGVQAAMMSPKTKGEMPRRQQNSAIAVSTPTMPPWKDMPPCQT